MDQVVEITGERAEVEIKVEEQVLELSIDTLAKIGGGVVIFPI